MSVLFNPASPSIRLRVYAAGPAARYYLDLVLDTGSSSTLIRPSHLAKLGIPLDRPVGRAELTAATGTASAPVHRLDTLFALGLRRSSLFVVAHDFPPTFTADGLLGLDFFRDHVLTLDFARGRITLGPPRAWWHVG